MATYSSYLGGPMQAAAIDKYKLKQKTAERSNAMGNRFGLQGILRGKANAQQQQPQQGNPFDQVLSGWEDAKAANEARYENILGQYNDREARNMERLQGLGDIQKQDVSERYANMAGNVHQDMVRRGLTGSTVSPTLQAGLEQERNNAMRRVEDDVRRQLVSTDAQLSGDKLQFMERREDAYPDLNMLTNLAMQYGQAGGGGQSGYGGGGGVGSGGLSLDMRGQPIFGGGGYDYYGVNPGFMMQPAYMGGGNSYKPQQQPQQQLTDTQKGLAEAVGQGVGRTAANIVSSKGNALKGVSNGVIGAAGYAKQGIDSLGQWLGGAPIAAAAVAGPSQYKPGAVAAPPPTGWGLLGSSLKSTLGRWALPSGPAKPTAYKKPKHLGEALGLPGPW